MDYRRFNMPDFNAIPRRDYLLALLSGVLVALSFPKPALSLLAWFAFVPLLLALGKKALGTDWPALPASLYLDFALNGNRSRYETPYFARRSLLATLTLAAINRHPDSPVSCSMRPFHSSREGRAIGGSNSIFEKSGKSLMPPPPPALPRESEFPAHPIGRV